MGIVNLVAKGMYKIAPERTTRYVQKRAVNASGRILHSGPLDAALKRVVMSKAKFIDIATTDPFGQDIIATTRLDTSFTYTGNIAGTTNSAFLRKVVGVRYPHQISIPVAAEKVGRFTVSGPQSGNKVPDFHGAVAGRCLFTTRRGMVTGPNTHEDSSRLGMVALDSSSMLIAVEKRGRLAVAERQLGNSAAGELDAFSTVVGGSFVIPSYIFPLKSEQVDRLLGSLPVDLRVSISDGDQDIFGRTILTGPKTHTSSDADQMNQVRPSKAIKVLTSVARKACIAGGGLLAGCLAFEIVNSLPAVILGGAPVTGFIFMNLIFAALCMGLVGIARNRK